MYPIIFMDEVMIESRIVNRGAYIAIGINLEGIKEVLGIWIGQNETSKYCLNILTEIKNRGVFLFAKIETISKKTMNLYS